MVVFIYMCLHTVSASQDDLSMLDLVLHHHFDQFLDSAFLVPGIQHFDIPFLNWHRLNEGLELVTGCPILGPNQLDTPGAPLIDG